MGEKQELHLREMIHLIEMDGRLCVVLLLRKILQKDEMKFKKVVEESSAT